MIKIKLSISINIDHNFCLADETTTAKINVDVFRKASLKHFGTK